MLANTFCSVAFISGPQCRASFLPGSAQGFRNRAPTRRMPARIQKGIPWRHRIDTLTPSIYFAFAKSGTPK
jgi:hypothetical protein